MNKKLLATMLSIQMISSLILPAMSPFVSKVKADEIIVVNPGGGSPPIIIDDIPDPPDRPDPPDTPTTPDVPIPPKDPDTPTTPDEPGDEGGGEKCNVNVTVNVINPKRKGTLFLNRVTVINNVISSDYKKKDYDYSKENCDLVEVLGEKVDINKYHDSTDPKLNYLIENNIYNRYENIAYSNRPGGVYALTYLTLPIKDELYKSDLIMSLLKKYEGVQEKEYSWKWIFYGQDSKDIPALEYKYRDRIKQDFFNTDLTITPRDNMHYYYSPNNKEVYMDRAVKLGLLNYYDLSTESDAVVLKKIGDKLGIKTTDILSKQFLKSITEKLKIGGNIEDTERNLVREIADKALKQKVITKADFSYTKLEQQASYDQYSFKTSNSDVIRNDVINYYQAISLIEQTMRIKEPYINDEEIKILNYYHGSEIRNNVPNSMKKTVEFLMAKGVIFPSDNLVDRKFTKKDFIELMYRVSNKDQRNTFKDIFISPDDMSLINKGFRKAELEMVPYKGLNDVSSVIGKDITIVDKGVTVVPISFKEFQFKNFFEPKSESKRVSLGLTREQYANRFFLTNTKRENTNDCGILGTDYNVRVRGNDLIFQISDTKLSQVKEIAKSSEEGLELNSSKLDDLPYNIRGVLNEGVYDWKYVDDTGNGVVTGKLANIVAPSFYAGTGSAIHDYVIKQKLYIPFEDAGANYFNWTDPTSKNMTPLLEAIHNNIVSVDSEPTIDNVGDMSIISVHFKISAQSKEMAISMLQSCLSINKEKWTGAVSINGLVDAEGKYYIGKDFLSYFGSIEVLDDKALINRDTGTYALLIDGTDAGSDSLLNTAIIGNTIKRYSSKDKFIISKIGGETYYSLDAIQDLLPSQSFRTMGLKDYFFGGADATETLVDLVVASQGEDPYVVQKDYTISHNGKDYLNLNNLNVGSDQVIIDLFNLMRSEDIKINAGNYSQSSGINPNLRMIIKWAWYVPTASLENVDLNNMRSISNMMFTKPNNINYARMYDLNVQITDHLLNMGIGTTNQSYSQSGYMCPQIVILGTQEDDEDSNGEEKSVMSFIKNTLFKELIEKNKTNYGDGKTADYEMFLDYVNSSRPTSMPFFDYHRVTDSEENTKFIGDSYAVDPKGSVYYNLGQQILSMTGNSYSMGSDRMVLLKPFQEITKMANLTVGDHYSYEASPNHGYLYLGNNRFLKDISDSHEINSPETTRNIPDINTVTYKTQLTASLNAVLDRYRVTDQLINEHLPKGHINYGVLKTFFPSHDEISSRALELNNLEKNRIDRAIRNYDYSVGGYGSYNLLTMYDNAYRLVATDGIQVGHKYTITREDEEGILPDNINRRLNIYKYPYLTQQDQMNVVAPAVTLDRRKYTVLNKFTTINLMDNNVTANGMIRKLKNLDPYPNLNYSYPNFNLAEDFINSKDKNRKMVKELPSGSLFSLDGQNTYKIVGHTDGGLSELGKGSANDLYITADELCSLGVFVNNKPTPMSSFFTLQDGVVYVNSDVYVTPSIARDIEIYTVSKRQRNIKTFSGIMAFKMNSLSLKSNSRFNFSYLKYKGEVPNDLNDVVKDFLKYYKELSSRSKKNTICLVIIQLLGLLAVMIWIGYLVTMQDIFKRRFISFKKDTGVDLLKIVTLWTCNLDREMSFLKVSVATLMIMLMQGIALKFIDFIK